MYRVKTFNKINKEGLETLNPQHYTISADAQNPEAILVRSANLQNIEFTNNLKCIARAGAGVNNIPIDKCTEKGIVVFNTPGANANAVKELVISSLILSSRPIIEGTNWVNASTLTGEDLSKEIEKQKSTFKGKEIKGKTLGVIGLGAIGSLVANTAIKLGMNVLGFDPYISIDGAWHLRTEVKKAASLEDLLQKSDFISIHIPQTNKTENLIDKNKIDCMKSGVKILNLSRDRLLVKKDILEALDSGKISCVVTDFPNESYIKHKKVICIPHLGASTQESEVNCAIMAAQQIKEFLEHGNIKNSVNFPETEMYYSGAKRLIVGNKNIPDMIRKITKVLSKNQINIATFINKNKNNVAYNIIEVESNVDKKIIDMIKNINGVLFTRFIG